MKKLLPLIINGCSVVLAIVTLFLGFAPLYSSITVVAGSITTNTKLDECDSLFKVIGGENPGKLMGVGVALIILLAIAILALVLVIVASLLKKSSKLEWAINAGAALLLIVSGILVLSIPAIIKDVQTVAGNTITTTANLAGGPIVAGIFALAAGVLQVLPVLKVFLKK